MPRIQIRWQPVEGGIRILQVYSELTHIHLPDRIAGQLVTEIGPYCFSATEPRYDLSSTFISSFSYAERYNGAGSQAALYTEEETSGSITRSIVLTEETRDLNGQTAGVTKDADSSPVTIPPFNGRYAQEITLPTGITVLHNAAFYNCRNLHTFSVGPCIRAIGSDEFTNCTRLTRLLYRGMALRKSSDLSGLALILSRIETDLDVHFLANDSSIRGALFFPEYYEWLDEVSPAHLFSRSIHGEGFRMRKSFQDGRLDYGKYDACFANACKTESERVLCRIALNRLRWPNGLTEACRERYLGTVREHFDTARNLAISGRDLALLAWLFTELAPDAGCFAEAIRQAGQADWGEGAAWLMDARHRQIFYARKTYDFEDLDI